MKILLNMPIKKIIAFGSAKGGVGKSSITASLALSLSKHKKIGILDADVYGPNQNILFKLDTKNEFPNTIFDFLSRSQSNIRQKIAIC